MKIVASLQYRDLITLFASLCIGIGHRDGAVVSLPLLRLIFFFPFPRAFHTTLFPSSGTFFVFFSAFPPGHGNYLLISSAFGEFPPWISVVGELFHFDSPCPPLLFPPLSGEHRFFSILTRSKKLLKQHALFPLEALPPPFLFPSHSMGVPFFMVLPKEPLFYRRPLPLIRGCFEHLGLGFLLSYPPCVRLHALLGDFPSPKDLFPPLKNILPSRASSPAFPP